MLDIKQFITAHPLDGHPVWNESFEYKAAYIRFIEMLGINKSGMYTRCTLEIYKKAFLSDLHTDITDVNINQLFKIVWSNPELRSCIISDIFHITGLNTVDKAAYYLKLWLKSLLNECEQKQVDSLFAGLDEYGSEEMLTYNELCCSLNGYHKSFPEQKVLVTATMSAGKSTLINALIGRNVNRTMNEACTAKIHYIYDKAFDDGLIHKWDNNITFDADEATLITDNENNKTNEVRVAIYFYTKTIAPKMVRMCLIDTPGVNNSRDLSHSDMTLQCLKETKYELLLYVLNAEHLGTDDDKAHLRNILTITGGRDILFVVNKIDKFHSSDDSIDDSISALRTDLKSIGFTEPIICPVSSRTALFAKMRMRGTTLDSHDTKELSFLQYKFNDKQYDLSRFYPKSNEWNRRFGEYGDLLVKSGLTGLEQIIYRRRGIVT